MSLNRRNFKDNKLRAFLNKFEKKKNLLKFLIINSSLLIYKRVNISKFLFNLPRSASLTLIQNKCILSGRARGVVTDFRLSRHLFKRYATRGNLVNIKKLF